VNGRYADWIGNLHPDGDGWLSNLRRTEQAYEALVFCGLILSINEKSYMYPTHWFYMWRKDADS